MFNLFTKKVYPFLVKANKDLEDITLNFDIEQVFKCLIKEFPEHEAIATINNLLSSGCKKGYTSSKELYLKGHYYIVKDSKLSLIS